MNNKNVIEKIQKCYEETITDIAATLNVTRSKIYTFMKAKKYDEKFANKLIDCYEDAFKESNQYSKGGDTQIKEEDIFEDEKPKKKAKKTKEKFTGDNQDIIDKSSEIKKGSEYVTPSKFLKMKNLKCKNGCYFMKVPLRDFDKIERPLCPHCKTKMLSIEERKEMGL